jgi:glycosyltransferase involved in cell wall biosynthesis
MTKAVDEPLVSVLTPVYNGEAFLGDCIDSVRAQRYRNWVYQIVNNCSTDGTLQIAQSYAAKDPRIRVTTNHKFVSMPANFNNAFALVSAESRYFKPVCADDWLLPECLSKMVAFAERNPSVGVLCCHQRSGRHVRWRELPPSTSVLTGREACRKALLERTQLFGAPTAFLYRTNLLGGGRPFFPNDRPHSDSSACYEVLDRCDYGVVHEILAVERVHDDQISSDLDNMAAGALAYIEVLLQYGPRYLSENEFRRRCKDVVDQYYRDLGRAVWKLKSGRFWRFQRSRASELGLEINRRRIAKAAAAEALIEARRPVTALRKVRDVLKSKLRR